MANSLWEMSTTAASNTSIGGANASEGCAPSSVNDAQRAAVAMTLGAQIGVTAAGTDTYTATLAPAPTTYTSGMELHIRFTNANTGAATLNANGLGAKSIVKNGASALVAGDIPAGHEGLLRYNGTNLVLMNPLGGTGTVTSVSDATNGGINVATGTTTPVISMKVSDLTATTPAQTDSLPYDNASAGATRKAVLAGAANSLVNIAAATKAQMQTGTDNTTVATPARVNDHDGTAKGSISFQMTSTGGIINSSYNVLSLTRNAAGDYTIAWTTVFSSANYVATALLNGPSSNYFGSVGAVTTKGSSTTRVVALNVSGGTFSDLSSSFMDVTVYGRQ